MKRLLLLAVVSMFATVASVQADDTQNLGRFKPSSGGISGGTSTAAEKEPTSKDDDTELVRFRRGVVFYGGYYAPYRYYYAPRFAYSYYPTYYSPPVYYSAPVYYSTPTYYSAPAYYWGGCATASAPVVSLSLKVDVPSTMPTERAAPDTIPPASTFKYDGDPAKTVPAPEPVKPAQPLPQPQPQSETNGSLKVKTGGETKPTLKYPAFGEKR